MPAIDVLSDLDVPRRRLRIGNWVYKADQDRAVTVLLTAATWLLRWLPGQVVQEQRGELIKTLAQAKDLRVMVRCGPTPAVLVYDGARMLVEMPARR